MSHLLLIRHGETDWNVEGRWQGQADVALNSRGLLQAEQIAESLCSVKIQAIYLHYQLEVDNFPTLNRG